MNTEPNRSVILLVDDDPHDVILIRLAFRKVGIIDTIHLVKNGAEALHYIKGEGPYANRNQYPAPTLVLLDLKMPQTSGFEVMDCIRNRADFKDLVVVVMSNSNLHADVRQAYELGASLYLVKPTRFSNLVRMMGSLMDCLHEGKKPLADRTDSRLAFINAAGETQAIS